jgi:hypothetical protein
LWSTVKETIVTMSCQRRPSYYRWMVIPSLSKLRGFDFDLHGKPILHLETEYFPLKMVDVPKARR